MTPKLIMGDEVLKMEKVSKRDVNIKKLPAGHKNQRPLG